ncbi:antitoxin [Streptomyces sp. J2-1]|uniref:antitoxin n=1 Tax=Streptomyces corallincola TaxID=2851888 RepID=UPI001C3841FE|nr:antitoxin [Streptomyces corallincola]MBV2357759.1 antitoxin [Streptomyces corallincola]
MGLMDNVKAALASAEDKVSDLARQHGDKVQHGIDKAARAVDDRTGHKYSDRIHAGTGKAKGAMDRLARKDGPDGMDTAGPGAGPAGPGPAGSATTGSGTTRPDAAGPATPGAGPEGTVPNSPPEGPPPVS